MKKKKINRVPTKTGRLLYHQLIRYRVPISILKNKKLDTLVSIAVLANNLYWVFTPSLYPLVKYPMCLSGKKEKKKEKESESLITKSNHNGGSNFFFFI
jgi:hypothetical protein